MSLLPLPSVTMGPIERPPEVLTAAIPMALLPRIAIEPRAVTVTAPALPDAVRVVGSGAPWVGGRCSSVELPPEVTAATPTFASPFNTLVTEITLPGPSVTSTAPPAPFLLLLLADQDRPPTLAA